jgi:hypothetical protein
MPQPHGTVEARLGDVLEAHAIHGGAPQRGRVVAILGQPGHEHYLVHWELGHESVVYPDDGLRLAGHGPGARRR